MYAIGPIEPATATRFEGLAPFEVRPVLRDLAALDRVHAVGATLMGRPIGLGLAVRGWAEPLALAGTPPLMGTARVLTLAVARGYRRIGVGRALLSALETSLQRKGVHSLTCSYALPPSDALVSLEALWHAAGWSAPEVTMLQCRAGRPILDAPLMREQLQLPPQYEIVDWVDLTADDRARIVERRQGEAWFPDTLDPFHFEPDMEVLNSLALRYRGSVVGWLITRRTGPTTMYYRCLFVRDDLARLGRGLALMREAIRRQADAIGTQPGLGEWSTPATLPAMVRFIKRHLVPFGAQVTEQRVVRKELGDKRTDSGPGPVTLRAARAPVARIALLSRAECDAALSQVRAAREHWTARTAPIAFHTFGAVAAIDGFDDAGEYERTAALVNPELLHRLGWLYQRVCAALAEALGAPVAPRKGWALPAFHILAPTRGANVPLGPIHCDTEHRYLEPGVAYDARPISFSLCISPPDARAGLTVWSLAYDETIGLDTEETSRLLAAVPSQFHPFTEGELVMFSADVYHQTTPLADLSPGRERVTLEGHVVPGPGGWGLYG